MPELPEVETVTRRLQEILPGKTITRLEIHHPKSFHGNIDDIQGQKITEVSRKAKVIRIHLNSNANLLTHLKMTGQLIFVDGDKRVGGGHPTADWTRSLPSNHTRLTYIFDDQTKLFFNDMRVFGWMKLLSDEEVAADFSKFGPDIIDPSVTAEYLYQQCQRRSVPVKTILMDTKVIGGVGNIYACDALNLARISPFRPAKELSFAEVERLLAATQQVIERGIELKGSTYDGKYVTVDGLAGGYQEEMLTYGREGQACYNCGAKILKEKIAGRGTYYCGVCQR